MKRIFVVALCAACSLLSSVVMAKAGDLGGPCCADLEERIAELEATAARKGNRKVSITVSGQVNKSILFVEGNEAVIDNRSDESRVTFSGVASIDAKTTAGYVLELASLDIGDGSEISVRRSAVYMDGELGRLTIGRYGSAGFEINELSAANTSAAVKALNGFGVSPFGGSLDDVVRYDSPSIAGFVVSASWSAADGDKELAVRYYTNFSDFSVVAGVAYLDRDGGETLSGSISGKHNPSGIFATVAAAAPRDLDAHVYHLMGGWEGKLTTLGATTFYAEYGNVNDAFGVDGWGVGVVQAIDAAALDTYISYRSFDDADLVLAGARVKF